MATPKRSASTGRFVKGKATKKRKPAAKKAVAKKRKPAAKKAVAKKRKPAAKKAKAKKPGSCSSAAATLASKKGESWRKSAAGSKMARKKSAGGCKK